MGLVKWSPEAQGHVPPPLPQLLGQPGLLLLLQGRLLHIPEVCKKKEVQLLPRAGKTLYLEVDRIQEWEIGLMG